MKVAIVGAGVAGLSAAQLLLERGIEVSVFEKSRGVGGRLATKRLDWGGIDIGAQYFTARDPRFQRQLALWQESGMVERWPFTPHKVSPTGLVLSPDATPRYVGVPKMNSLTHGLALGVDIRFSMRVEHIARDQEGWALTIADQGELAERYDWLLLSAPAEQARLLAANTALADRLPGGLYQPCWALALATKGAVPEAIQGIFGDHTVSWVSRLSARPQRSFVADCDDVWMLHFSSEWSTSHSKTTKVNVAEVGFEWLSSVLQAHIDCPLTLSKSYQHYWLYARVAESMTSPPIVVDAATGIAAVGDWTEGGRVEGAYLSALKLIEHWNPVPMT